MRDDSEETDNFRVASAGETPNFSLPYSYLIHNRNKKVNHV